MPVHHSVRPSLTFLAIVAVTAFGGVLAWWDGVQTGALARAAVFVFVIAGWVVSLCLHEFGHAFTAWRFGDRSVAVRGYLDLDPRRYSNPWLSLGIPILITALGGIGLPGAAVYLRTSSMTPTQRTIVSLAGPSANLLVAMLLLGLTNAFFDPAHPVFWAGVAFLGFLQITALLLNLIPLPGLDGYNALEPHLSPESQRALEQFKPYGIIFLVFLLLVPQVGQLFFGIVSWFFELSGVPAFLWQAGAALTRFWNAWF
jgi:Zn-dependent protease